MTESYSAAEARARFSEILRKVRAGESALVTYRGRTVAEIRPSGEALSQEARIRMLEKAGVLAPAAKSHNGMLRPIADRPGALQRFLDERR
jgi:prevent-host-death family protein